ncbi:MAG TPA: TAT-variant-translocated molybdopterin oxidoreductase [Thermoanaerobaculia bacterium]|jgi:molybdopterin-containing oxidoreductase family iron-sulfur binding subunit
MDSVNAKGKCGAEAAPQPGTARLDLEEVREKLRTRKGPEFWRSLDELAGTPEFEDLLQREFPRFASEWPSGVSRRGFLQLASASLALAGLTGCTKQPLEKIIPYVRQPEQLIPGKPLFFATASTHAGYALGVLAESHQGRPTKIEGNPDHPASRGAADAFAQASLLTLYDPDRSQEILHNGRVATWSAFAGQIGESLRSLGADKGLRILTGTVTSPTLADLIQGVLAKNPEARWHRWEPAGPHQSRAAAQRAFGRYVDTRYDFTKAKVVLSLGADVLCEGAAGVRYARDFADGRRVHAHRDAMTRVYSVESVPVGLTSLADHRLQLPPAQVEGFVLALAQTLGAVPGTTQLANPKAQTWLPEVAKDLQANRGASLVVADEYLSPAAQVLVHAVNQSLGNVGTTVFYQDPVEAEPVDHVQSLRDLVNDMSSGQVQALLILDGVNPVYTAPADVPFRAAMEKVPLRIHHGLYMNETALHCHWHIPAAHELESWGDARSFDGTVSILQPLIEPLYGGRTAAELVAATLANQADATSYDLVRQYWTPRLPGLTAGLAEVARDTTGGGSATTLLGFGGPFPGAPGIPANVGAATPPATPGNQGTAPAAAPAAGANAAFEKAWREAVHAGLIPDTAAKPAAAAFNGGAAQQAATEIQAALTAAKPGEITLLLRPDPTIWDGRYASNVWLQELPKPVTKIVWDNALILGVKTAERLKLTYHDTADVSVGGRTVKGVAVWVLPGVAEDTAVLHLGYGREAAGKASGMGFNAYPLRASQALWAAPGATVKGAGGRYIVACTQNHHAMRGVAFRTILHEDEEAAQQQEARHVIRTGTLAELQRDPQFIQKDREVPPRDETLYKNFEYSGHAWGMSIDLSVCTGCSACIVACQAENNIPSVGKDQVLARREMHWLRVDRYWEGALDEPTSFHYQPLPCMQCENAPCEVVCPVAATVHSDEGLNDMVYNRCVGTRYCSNNCPYKVRRFNFLRFSDKSTPVLELVNNPDVTVRMRGVMEKCTYCVQRIEAAKIQSKVDNQPIPANWLQTACQQSCPTGAIVFGDINNAESEVTKLKADPLNYGLLEDINTRPRTTYLAKLRNPNPALSEANPAQGAEHGHA